MAEETNEKWLRWSLDMEVLGLFTPVKQREDENDGEDISGVIALASACAAAASGTV